MSAQEKENHLTVKCSRFVIPEFGPNVDYVMMIAKLKEMLCEENWPFFKDGVQLGLVMGFKGKFTPNEVICESPYKETNVKDYWMRQIYEDDDLTTKSYVEIKLAGKVLNLGTNVSIKLKVYMKTFLEDFEMMHMIYFGVSLGFIEKLRGKVNPPLRTILTASHDPETTHDFWQHGRWSEKKPGNMGSSDTEMTEGTSQEPSTGARGDNEDATGGPGR